MAGELQTFTDEELDRTITEYLRRAVVAKGYLPDRRSFTNAQREQWKAARAAITAAGEEIIDVYGVGPWLDRDGTTSCKIVVDSSEEERGDVGTQGLDYFTRDTDELSIDTIFTKNQYPDSMQNLVYTIRAVSKKESYDRIIKRIIRNVFGTGRYIKAWNEESGEFIDKYIFIEYLGTSDVSTRDFIERIFKFRVKDIFLEDPVVLREGIPVLKKIFADIYISNHDGTEEQQVYFTGLLYFSPYGTGNQNKYFAPTGLSNRVFVPYNFNAMDDELIPVNLNSVQQQNTGISGISYILALKNGQEVKIPSSNVLADLASQGWQPATFVLNNAASLTDPRLAGLIDTLRIDNAGTTLADLGTKTGNTITFYNNMDGILSLWYNTYGVTAPEPTLNKIVTQQTGPYSLVVPAGMMVSSVHIQPAAAETFALTRSDGGPNLIASNTVAPGGVKSYKLDTVLSFDNDVTITFTGMVGSVRYIIYLK